MPSLKGKVPSCCLHMSCGSELYCHPVFRVTVRRYFAAFLRFSSSASPKAVLFSAHGIPHRRSRSAPFSTNTFKLSTLLLRAASIRAVWTAWGAHPGRAERHCLEKPRGQRFRVRGIVITRF